MEVLKQFPEFIAFQTPKAIDETGSSITTPPTSPELPESAVTPEEAIEQAEAQIFENLKSQLLVRTLEKSPREHGDPNNLADAIHALSIHLRGSDP